MKRIVAISISTLFAVSLLLAPVVFAHEGETETTPTDPKSLAERIQKRKTELKISLTNTEKVRIKAKCKASQGLLSSVGGRVKGIETSRTQVHQNIIKHLTELSEKLKNKGVDTTELDANITKLQELINTFNIDLDAYKHAVSDLVAIDCATDPDGFKASLETARTALKKTQDDSKAIRAYVKDVIKPLLATIRAGLEAKKTEGSE